MDYLTTNWTEKIKTNPVANAMLNSKKYTFTGVIFGKKLQAPYQIQESGRITGGGVGRQALIRSDEWEEFERQFPDEKDAPEIYMNTRRQFASRNFPVDKASVQYHVKTGDIFKSEDDYWDNLAVDYINISHPKNRPCYVSAMSSHPLQIKPPSVFFSDV